jgi:hypothetical protein
LLPVIGRQVIADNLQHHGQSRHTHQGKAASEPGQPAAAAHSKP